MIFSTGPGNSQNEPGDAFSSVDNSPGYSSNYNQLSVEFSQEIGYLYPYFIKACQRWNIPEDGLSGIKPSQYPDFLIPLIEGRAPSNPYREIPLIFLLKNCILDLKRYYAECFFEQQPEAKISEDLTEWFWQQTVAGDVLKKLDNVCRSSSDRMMNVIGSHFIMLGHPIHNPARR